MSSCVVLFSGGMDSVIAYYWALGQFEHIHLLTFRYGQRHWAEVEHAELIAGLPKRQGLYSNTSSLVKIDLVGVMPRVGSLMDFSIPVQKYAGSPQGDDPSFIPYRNLLFLTVAAQWARTLGATEIITGLRGGFPDCTERFEAYVSTVLKIADPTYPIEISSPVHKSRADSLRLALSLAGCWGALAHSMTCFEGLEPPCGQCLPCRKRAEGFAEINQADPLLQRLSSNA